ncbi:MAG: CD225/dispanin family protein [Gordonia sp. (in: high G+C Gram-positive bacteria)]|uniref:CD225/dispanin family protein n=1 Tax=Gordonia sp. (in: high G+C Gram-positive bacteria) TaxID=84139 RepID=UPI0039E47D67
MTDPQNPDEKADDAMTSAPADDTLAAAPAEPDPAVNLSKQPSSAEPGAYDETQIGAAYTPPTYESPSYESPSYESPSYQSPSYETPGYVPPVYGGPATGPDAPVPGPPAVPPTPEGPPPPAADPYAFSPMPDPFAAPQQAVPPQAMPYQPPAQNPYSVPAPPYSPYGGYQVPGAIPPATGQVSAIICVVVSALMTVSCYFTLIGLAPLIVGIVALVRSNSVETLWRTGQAEAAQRAAESSKTLAMWAWLSMVIGVIVVVLIGIIVLVAVGTG